MSDQLFLRYQLRGYTEANMLRHFEKALRLFPFSKLSSQGILLRIGAVNWREPLVLERAFQQEEGLDEVLASALEYSGRDCAVEIHAWWDLWQQQPDWKLAPARVTLCCFGPEFEDRDDDIRLDLGIDSLFLPERETPEALRMSVENLRSLLKLVKDLDGALQVEKRVIETEAGENFAERLKELAG